MATPDCRDSPPTLGEANKRLQETMKHAREGKTADALHGVVNVVQSAFAAVLKGAIDAPTALEEKCRELEKQLKEKDELRAAVERDLRRIISGKNESITKFRAMCDANHKKTRALLATVEANQKTADSSKGTCKALEQECNALKLTAQHTEDAIKEVLNQTIMENNNDIQNKAQDAELATAKAKAAAFRQGLNVIINQAGQATKVYFVIKEEPLSDTLDDYAEVTKQEQNSLMVVSSSGSQDGLVVDPAQETMVPEPIVDGSVKYQAYMVIKAAMPSAKRKPTDSDDGGPRKK
ncbi:hypothetical protein LTR15_006842 [Elasticomyces elasticus]|nr:hypothetical protein LTR15_006842 [Elasticomyces elasticus]